MENSGILSPNGCISAKIEAIINDGLKTARFMDCKNCSECMLNCSESREKRDQTTLLFLFGVVKEIYSLARRLYAIQKAIEAGKDSGL